MKNIFKKTFSIKKHKLPIVLQAEVTECGHACLTMILQYCGYNIHLSALRRIFPTSLKGISLANIIKMAEHFNLKTRVFRIELEQLETLKLPAIIHWDMDHFVVLKEVKKKIIKIHDPARGERTLNLEKASKHFTGIALEIDNFERKLNFQAKDKKLKLLTLLKDVSGFKREVIYIIILAFLLQIIVLLGPKYMQLVIDRVIVTNNMQLLYLLVFAFLGLKILETLVTAIRSLVVTNFGLIMNFHLGTKVFNHLIKLPFEYFSKRHLGDILSRFGSIEQIRQLVTQGLIEGAIDGVMAILTLVIMSLYSLWLSMIVFGIVILYSLVRLSLFPKFKEANESMLNLQAIQNSSFMESVRGIQPIKIFAKEKNRSNTWQKKYTLFLNLTTKIAKLNTLFIGSKTFFLGIELIIVVFYGAILIIHGKFTIGMLYAFVFYQILFVTAADNLMQKCWSYRMLSLYLDRLSDIVFKKVEKLNKNIFNGKISCNNLKAEKLFFRYSDTEPYVIKDLSLKITHGEFVAITGHSGCGKTTLLKIMMGLLRPTKGQIIIDGTDLGTIDMEKYRKNISAVMQEDSLFAGSIFDNISFFDENPDKNKIIECTKIAGIFDDIKSMPMEFYTLVGDMGSTLSGGQKQRILLARALYTNPKILFLDEATSHLDSQKEHQVNIAIKKLGITRITVAHRQETIEMADRIISLDKPSEN